jgi:exonuclease SbcC
MLITKVELENIKSYRSATIELRRGTTAIRGQNGAGKTTLVEAIGFALFDYLPYNQAQFVREGERSGQVTVSFISGYDGCLYQVVRRCGSPSAWYVFNPQTGAREVEQRADVIDWLRTHLPLQGEIELGAFFSDALGVQQGTFTSDFLATPASRKRKFDALLQVEDYRRAHDKLRETYNYLQQSAEKVNGQVERLEDETRAIGAWRDELLALRAQQDTGTGRLLTMQEERDQAEKLRGALSQLRDEVARLDSERKQAEHEWRLTRQALEQAQSGLSEAQAAQSKLEESAEDHQRYLQAGADLRAAREEQQKQQVLLARQAAQKQEQAEALATVRHAEDQLAKAGAARQRMTELAPLVEEQTALEQQKNDAAQQVRRLHEIEQEIMRLEKDGARLQGELDKLARQIAAIEAQRAEAALRAERQAEVERLRLEAQRRDDRERELKQVRESLRGWETQRKQANADVEKQQANVHKLYDARPLVATLPALEAEWNELRQQVLLLQGNIKRHNESKLQSAGGHCPFLKEPCLNIQRQGLSSLETYFDGLMVRDQAALHPLKAREAELDKQVQDVRKKKSYVDQLEDYEQHLREALERQEHARREIERLIAREHELVALVSAADESAPRLAEAQELLLRSDEADKQVRKLEVLISQQHSQQQQLEAQSQQLEALRAEQADLADAPAREEQARQKLAALGDPRRDYAQQEAIARQEPEAARLLEAARQKAAQAEETLALLDAQLAPYAGLDRRIAQLDQQSEQSRVGYQTYLANEQLAGKVPERQAAYDAALASERQAQERYLLAERCHAEQAAGFDPQALLAAEQEEQRLREELARLREELRSLKEKMAQQEQKIAEAEGKLIELEAARAEHAELLETRDMLQQFREKIKEAGPYVMKELLRQISKDANHIFGDILGDHSIELSWEENYEIVLRARGQARSIAQLSGGEQMSAALAVRLALLRTLATKLDVAFFDEPTQSMDEQRRINLAEQIRRVRGFSQLIVISHDDTFEQGLDSVIFLQKRDGETIVSDGELALVGSGAEMGFDGADA